MSSTYRGGDQTMIEAIVPGPGVSGVGVVRVILLSRFRLYAECVAVALNAEDDLDVVGYSTSVAEALEALQVLQPDLIVVPDDHDGWSCAELALRCRDVAAAVGVFVVAGQRSSRDLVDALDAGVIGHLPGQRDLRTLKEYLRQAADGIAAVAPELLVELGAEPDVAITGRERQIIALLARGLTTDTIAGELAISTHTVRTHVRSAMTKLNVHSRLQLVRRAMDERIVAAQ